MMIVLSFALIFIGSAVAMFMVIAGQRTQQWRSIYDEFGTTGSWDLDLKFANEDATRQFYKWASKLTATPFHPKPLTKPSPLDRESS